MTQLLRKANLRQRNLGLRLRLRNRKKGLTSQIILKPGHCFSTDLRATPDAANTPVIYSEQEAKPPNVETPRGRRASDELANPTRALPEVRPKKKLGVRSRYRI